MLATTHCDAEASRRLREHLGPRDRRGVDAHLVRARAQRPPTSSADRTPPPIVSGMNSRSAVRRATSSSVAALLGARRDVEEDDLVRALALVALGELHRIADVAQLHELRALHDAPALHVQADDEPPRQHQLLTFRHAVRRHPWC